MCEFDNVLVELEVVKILLVFVVEEKIVVVVKFVCYENFV